MSEEGQRDNKGRFVKGNTEWQKSEEWMGNIGRINSENRHEIQDKINAGIKRYHQRKALKDDMFFDITKGDGVSKAMDKIVDLAEKGDVRPMIDILKILTPKDVDITSGGEKVQMGNVIKDGKDLELKIGDKVKKEEE